MAEARAASASLATSTTPTHLRGGAELTELLGGLPLADPGLVDVAHWAQSPTDDPLGGYGAITEPL